MINAAFQKTVHSWATTEKTSFNKIITMCDSLKGIGTGKALAILVPSYLMLKIPYKKLISNPNIHTMTVNNGYLMPETTKCEYYLPLTTYNKTRSMNNNPKYVQWLKTFKGLVMHGFNYNDGTNTQTPYLLASQTEVKDIIEKCPKTKFSIWHHSWGDYVKKKGVKGMLECPYYSQWTPRRIPWGHCGAVSGFALPLAMALGYERIYIVAMGYKYVILGYHNPPKNIQEADQRKAADSWLQFAKTRFANQATLAQNNSVELQVGPKQLLEPELIALFNTFNNVNDCI